MFGFFKKVTEGELKDLEARLEILSQEYDVVCKQQRAARYSTIEGYRTRALLERLHKELTIKRYELERKCKKFYKNS